jgi:hypothetical protein
MHSNALRDTPTPSRSHMRRNSDTSSARAFEGANISPEGNLIKTKAGVDMPALFVNIMLVPNQPLTTGVDLSSLYIYSSMGIKFSNVFPLTQM